MSTVLTVNHVSKIFKTQTEAGNKKLTAVNNINFALEEGQSFGILGASGCGKTTLLQLIVGLLSPTSGIISKPGLAGFVPQDPYDSLCPAYNVEQIIAEPLLYSKKAKSLKACQNDIKSAMAQVKLNYDTYAKRAPSQLSGGERQRVSIARAMINKPSMLVLDEPTSMVDYEVKNDIAETILQTAKTTNTAILLVTHDISLVSKVCQTIAVMNHGVFVEVGSVNQITKNPQHDFTKKLIAAGTDLMKYWAGNSY